jgi:hypothetical protein
VKNLDAGGVGQQLDEIRGAVHALPELYEVRIAVAVGKLHKTQAIPLVIQPHGFGINRDVTIQRHIGRQVALMQIIRYNASP